MSYWIIKTLLVVGLFVVAFLMMRPVNTASHLALRRLAVMGIIVLAAVSVIFPEAVTRLAQSIGVYSGVNLLVYILVLAMFTQMAIGYRRDAVNERKLTRLARAIALNSAIKPPRGDGSHEASSHLEPGRNRTVNDPKTPQDLPEHE